MPSMANPVGAGLRPERIDMGVDYGGSGPLYAIGAGTITSVYNSGWPGGTFIGLHLTGTNQYVYYAEDINPAVTIGQTVAAGQIIGHATGGSSGVELGWAAPPGSGTTMAAATGQNKAGLARGDPGYFPTGYGVSFSNLIHSLGGPAGTQSGPVQGAVPNLGGAPIGAVLTSATSGLPAGCIPGSGLVVMAYALFCRVEWRRNVPRRKLGYRQSARKTYKQRKGRGAGKGDASGRA